MIRTPTNATTVRMTRAISAAVSAHSIEVAPRVLRQKGPAFFFMQASNAITGPTRARAHPLIGEFRPEPERDGPVLARPEFAFVPRAPLRH